MNLPSFSLIIESENLHAVDPSYLEGALRSLAAQSLSPAQAKECILIQSGDIPAALEEHLAKNYPWLEVRRVDADVNYYDTKMIGAELTTGEIAVYADSDCVYDPRWLETLVQYLIDYPDAVMIGGEAAPWIRNAYELAVAANHYFKPFSEKPGPYLAANYNINGAAFRRRWLLDHPIPSSLPIYRGQCCMHAYFMTRCGGHQVIRHPKARSLHAMPSFPFVLRRMIALGADQIRRAQWRRVLKRYPAITTVPGMISVLQDIRPPKKWQLVKLTLQPHRKWRHLKALLKEDPSRTRFLPLAVPLMLIFYFLYSLGVLVGFLDEKFFIDLDREGASPQPARC